MHNVDLLVSIPRFFFFRNHGCQEDPLNKPVIAGYFFLRLKIKQFQLQSKIECEIVWNLSWIYFLPSPTTGGSLNHDFGSEILGPRIWWSYPEVSPAVWQESLAVQLYVTLSLKHQADSGGWHVMVTLKFDKIRNTLERQSWKTSPIVVCCKMGFGQCSERSLGTNI